MIKGPDTRVMGVYLPSRLKLSRDGSVPPALWNTHQVPCNQSRYDSLRWGSTGRPTQGQGCGYPASVSKRFIR